MKRLRLSSGNSLIFLTLLVVQRSAAELTGTKASSPASRDLGLLGLGNSNTHVAETGMLSDLKIGILDSLDSSSINPFRIFDVFLNQTRSTIPLIANAGNFTLLQAALLCAVGALACGAGAIALEAFYFKSINDQTEAYNAQQAQFGAYGGSAYGLPPQPAYGYGGNHRRGLEVPVRGAQPPRPPRPTLSAKRLKPQSLRRTQRRNQRKNMMGPQQPPPSRKKRHAYEGGIVVPYPTVAPRPYVDYAYNPYQGYYGPGPAYNGQSPNSYYVYSSPRRTASDTVSEAPGNSWFQQFRWAPLNPRKNMISRNFQRYL